MNNQDPVQSWLQRLAPNSRSTAEGSIRQSASILFPDGVCRWNEIDVNEMGMLAAELGKKKMPSTVAKDMSFVREVVRECWRLGMKSHEDLQRAVSVRWRRPASPPVGRHLQKDERSRVMDACGEGMIGLRNRALMRLLLLGLRRAEAACVRAENISQDTSSIRIDGKGRRRRDVFIGPKAAEDIRAYMAIRGDESGFLILPFDHGKFSSPSRPITLRAVNKIVAGICARSGVKFTPHDMRRSAIGDWLGSVGVEVAMKMAGHSNPQTTARYDHRNIEDAARRAAASSEV